MPVRRRTGESERTTLDLLKDDFKLFLQALWAQLDLLTQPVHNMQSLITYNTDLNVYRSKPSEVWANPGLPVLLFFGLCLTMLKKR